MDEDQSGPIAAWYQDPSNPAQIRYWDGISWTEHVAPIETLAPSESESQPTSGTSTSKPFGRSGLGLAQLAHEHETPSHKKSLGLSDGGISRYNHRGAPAHEHTSEVDSHVSGGAGPGAALHEMSSPELGSGWHVAEDIHVGSELMVEHLIIGPAGVFSLCTRNHGDSEVWVAERSFLVDGHQTGYLRDARHNARAVAHILSSRCGFDVAVNAVIVVDTHNLTIKAQPIDAHVVGLQQVGKWFARMEPTLSPEMVARVWQVVSDRATWSAPTDTDSTTPAPATRRSLFG